MELGSYSARAKNSAAARAERMDRAWAEGEVSVGVWLLPPQELYYSSSELVRAIDRECILTGLVLAKGAALPSASYTTYPG